MNYSKICLLLMTICFIIITFTLVLSKSASEWVKDGYNLYNRAKYAEALKSYKEALKQEPESYEIHLAIGKCYYKLGDYEEAIRFYNKAIELNGDTLFTVYYNKGKAYLDLKDYKEAIDCFNEALKIKPGNTEANNRKEEAEGFLSLSKNIKPGNTEANNRKEEAERFLSLSKNSSCETWNLEEDFDSSNNDGPWFFGYKEKLQSSFEVFPLKSPNAYDTFAWANTRDTKAPCVWKNTLSRPDYCIPPDKVSFHPGADGEYVTIRWTAAFFGKINISGTFGEGDKGYVDVYILKNNKILFSKLNTNNDEPFDLNISVNKGDNIDFEAGMGQDGYGYTNTLLEVMIRKL